MDIAVDYFSSFRIHGDCARTVHGSIGDDGLRIDTRKWFRSLVSEDCGLGRHVGSFWAARRLNSFCWVLKNDSVNLCGFYKTCSAEHLRLYFSVRLRFRFRLPKYWLSPAGVGVEVENKDAKTVLYLCESLSRVASYLPRSTYSIRALIMNHFCSTRD